MMLKDVCALVEDSLFSICRLREAASRIAANLPPDSKIIDNHRPNSYDVEKGVARFATAVSSG